MPAAAAAWTAPLRSPRRRRRAEHAVDFIRASVSAQFRTEFHNYFLGWVWWILEPVTTALTFFLVVFLFFHLPGDRLWVIVVSVVAFRWFGRSVDIAAHLAGQFAPVVRSGVVSFELLYATFVIKETIVFAVGMVVIMIPVAVWAHPFSIHLLELPLIILCQALLIGWTAMLSMVVGGLVHDVGKIVGLLVSIWFYFSPGLYIRTDASHLPHWVLQVLALNPFWAILTSWQNVLVRGTGSDLAGLVVWSALSVAALPFAWLVLRRARRRLLLAEDG